MAKKKRSSLGKYRGDKHQSSWGGTDLTWSGADGPAQSSLWYENYDQPFRKKDGSVSTPEGTARMGDAYDDDGENGNGEIKLSNVTRDILRARSLKRTWKNDPYTTRPHSTDPKRDRAYALAAG